MMTLLPIHPSFNLAPRVARFGADRQIVNEWDFSGVPQDEPLPEDSLHIVGDVSPLDFDVPLDAPGVNLN